MNDGRQKTVFKNILIELLERFKEGVGPEAEPPFIGAEALPALEHTTRRHFVDRMLSALGWNLANLDEEIVEEARVGQSRTLFLDYLGVDRELRTPLMIVEAKAWGKPFVALSSRAAQRYDRNIATTNPAFLIAAAISYCKSGEPLENSPVILEWAEWIAKLHQYVSSVHQQTGHSVRRVALTSGDWLVIFADPAKTFLDTGVVRDLEILVYSRNLLVEHSDDIFELLAQARLVSSPPEILNPRQVRGYIRIDTVSRLFRAVWISHRRAGAHFDAYPQLDIYVAAVLQRADQTLLTVMPVQRERMPLPADETHLAQHLADVEKASEGLLAALQSQLGDLPSRVLSRNSSAFVNHDGRPPLQAASGGLRKPHPAEGSFWL